MTGTTLGHYEIGGKLGEGGMGAVYRARDRRLGRDVAIKVLPTEFASAPDRLARFEREAQVLASLNHPNVATLYGFEDLGGLPFLVMELVSGQTLRDRIARAALPLTEALTIAKQVADGLEAAHDKGIVHRDLKPANVMITPDGRVKLLDFGLAKAFDLTREAAESPTVTMSGTGAGVVLGTVSYMSPEQARGADVDKRTDIWAFGCCLFEMLTGRRSFGGETPPDTMAKIIEVEPDWRRLDASVPARVRDLLARCLTKEPRNRRPRHRRRADRNRAGAVRAGRTSPRHATELAHADSGRRAGGRGGWRGGLGAHALVGGSTGVGDPIRGAIAREWNARDNPSRAGYQFQCHRRVGGDLTGRPDDRIPDADRRHRSFVSTSIGPARGNRRRGIRRRHAYRSSPPTGAR